MAEKDIWFLKLSCWIYKDEKLTAIREETKGLDCFYIWICFLCLAAKKKRDGSLYLSDNVPYTPPLLAGEIKVTEEMIETAIQLFQKMDMITVNDGIIQLKNWKKYQTMLDTEEYRSKNAARVKRYRERKKMESDGNLNELHSESGSSLKNWDSFAGKKGKIVVVGMDEG